MGYPTLAELRAQLDTAKVVAMDRFERDWGTRDVAKVMGALRQSIPTATSQAQAVIAARKLLTRP